MRFHRPRSNALFRVAVVSGVVSVVTLWIAVIQYPQTTGMVNFKVSALKGLETQKGDLFSNIQSALPRIIAQGGIQGAVDLIYTAVQRKKIDFTSCHKLLHEVGHRAYSYYKRDFVQIAQHVDKGCQEAYQHGVEAQIVLENDAPRGDLKDFCQVVRKTEPTIQCYHGAGHGFMDKSNGDVDYALGQCVLLGDNAGVQSCYSGVFSEYGNRVLGVDGHTGLRLSGKPATVTKTEHPLEFCQTLASQYREACSSQLVKLQFTVNLTDSLHACVYEGYSKETQVTCVQMSGFFYAGNTLSHANTVPVPPIAFLPGYLRIPFLRGVLMGFTQAQRTNVPVDIKGFCDHFSGEEKTFCYKNAPKSTVTPDI